jgi:hypothetical protein
MNIIENLWDHLDRMVCAQDPLCYGRLAVVSDVDDGGVCPECRQGVERICHAISKQVQRSDAGIEVDVMHTGNECTEQAQRMY